LADVSKITLINSRVGGKPLSSNSICPTLPTQRKQLIKSFHIVGSMSEKYLSKLVQYLGKPPFFTLLPSISL
jgi:hypothetical protein